MISYRTFHNSDPPKILDLWNSAATARGFGRINGCDTLEQYLFSKPYFDRNGLFLAEEDGKVVGLGHGGFGCDDSFAQLDTGYGVLCMLLVHHDHRRKGIGTELLRRVQGYLRDRGATHQYAGALHPLNPFYLGLYGGSELPGILESDVEMTRFVQNRGYTRIDTCTVYDRRLDTAATVEDNRLPLLRREVDILVEPWPIPPSWWHACTMGPMITLRYEMVERSTRAPIGHAWAWEMDTFGNRWRFPTVGITNFHIAEERRRYGFASLLLQGILKHLQDQRVGIVEIQTMQRNVAARGLYEKFGFQQVDTGHAYQLDG